MLTTVRFSLASPRATRSTGFSSSAGSWRVYSLTSKLLPHHPRGGALRHWARLERGIAKHAHHLQMQQIRPYLYLPLTWSDLRERVQRWVERTERRIVQVSLLRRGDSKGGASSLTSSSLTKTTPPLRLPRRKYFTRKGFQGRKAQLKAWMKRQQQRAVNRISGSIPLPPINQIPGTTSLSSWSDGANLRSRYQGWKIRRKEQYQGWKSWRQEQYQGWKSRRQEQYQGWKLRRRAQYQRWNDKRDKAWVRTLQVLLEEYSKPEWFDSLGRPLTSRDSTGRFVNPWQSQSTNGIHSVETILRWRWQRFERELNQLGLLGLMMPPLPWMSKPKSTSPLLDQAVPPLPTPKESQCQLTWVGHATCWLQMEDHFTVLTDPMFSVRAGPFQKGPIGVARDVPPAFTVRELVEHQKRLQRLKASSAGQAEETIVNNENYGKIDICCITHDHYDHMDKTSVTDLRDCVQLWVVPLGLADWLAENCSIDPSRIVELQWWQQVEVGKNDSNGTVVVLQQDDGTNEYDSLRRQGKTVEITCCPSSHWASRTMSDRNFRLWCSFAFSTTSFKFFLCGDTGYPEVFPLFRQIGDALGPFDLAAIPIGAYGTSNSLLLID
jgi:N-acyl-phosphatidylethanolamine-hydrolysing phospholipase D